MPEGVEWPRYETGEPVKLGGSVEDEDGDEAEVAYITFFEDHVECGLFNGVETYPVDIDHGDRFKRPVSEVLDADGAEIREGDTVWHTESDEQAIVLDVERRRAVSVEFEPSDGGCKHTGTITAKHLTHRAPVLAADGKPLREGETVWNKNGLARGVVESIDADSLMHTTRYRGDSGVVYRDAAKDLVHERPDSWECLKDDATRPPRDYCGMLLHWAIVPEQDDAHYIEGMASDLVRRAKKLAGVE